MSTFNKHINENLVQARRDFFEKGNTPKLINGPILNSWQRCIRNGLKDRDTITFIPVIHSQVKDLQESNKAIMDIFDGILEKLTVTSVNANYLITLTDRNGIALSVHGNLNNQSKLMQTVFRPGISFSENSIGTNAMACSINERRPVSIIGAEHFLESNRHFHCAAAPIFNPTGEVVGTVNISRDDNRPDFGAINLVSECATAIELKLFLQLNAAFSIQLQLLSGSHKTQETILMAFEEGGEVIALSRAASQLLGNIQIQDKLRFEDIFNEVFSESIAQLKPKGFMQTLLLQSGITVCVQVIHGLSTSVIDNKQGSKKSNNYLELGDPQLSEKCAQAQHLWEAGLPILITGETGSGKEVVANHLHLHGLPKSAPFVSVNCAAIPESLIESELFGYSEGAFTGAARGGATGKIEQADGGTLFLDEIGDMPFALQARLLRVLETGEISRLGSNKPKHIKFKLISATNQDIEHAINTSQFRKDLFYRINGCRLKLSALRDRPNISLLINKLLANESNNTAELTAGALDSLLTYSWPGNVRELRTAIKYGLATSENGTRICRNNLPEEIWNRSVCNKYGLEQETQVNTTDISVLEQAAIEQALVQVNGKVSEAAKLLGISRATLYRRLKDKKAPN